MSGVLAGVPENEFPDSSDSTNEEVKSREREAGVEPRDDSSVE